MTDAKAHVVRVRRYEKSFVYPPNHACGTTSTPRSPLKRGMGTCRRGRLQRTGRMEAAGHLWKGRRQVICLFAKSERTLLAPARRATTWRWL